MGLNQKALSFSAKPRYTDLFVNVIRSVVLMTLPLLSSCVFILRITISYLVSPCGET